MTDSKVLQVDQIKRKYELQAIEVFYDLIKRKDKQAITADDIRVAMIAKEIHPFYISKVVGTLVKSAIANRLLLKTTEYKLSARSSKPLPCFICNHKGT